MIWTADKSQRAEAFRKSLNFVDMLRMQDRFEVGSKEWKLLGGLWNGMQDLHGEMKELRRELRLANDSAHRRKLALQSAGVLVPEDPKDEHHV